MKGTLSMKVIKPFSWLLGIVAYVLLFQLFLYLGHGFWMSFLMVFGVSILLNAVRYKLRYRGIKVSLTENSKWFLDGKIQAGKSKGDDVDGY